MGEEGRSRDRSREGGGGPGKGKSPGRRPQKDHHNGFNEALDKAADDAVRKGHVNEPLLMELEVEVSANPGEINEYRVILKPRH